MSCRRPGSSEYRVNVVAVVLNDRAYGNVKRIRRELYGNRVIASDLTNPDLPRLAASCFIFSRRATTRTSFEPPLDRALARNEPALIEVPLGAWCCIIPPRVRR